MDPIFKRSLIFIVSSLFLLIAIYLLFILNYHVQSPLKNSDNKTSSVCPADYCNDWISGSCAEVGKRYRERECYHYSEDIKNQSLCESLKKIYYEKGSVPDNSC